MWYVVRSKKFIYRSNLNKNLVIALRLIKQYKPQHTRILMYESEFLC
jgi:hypothetical protein